MLRKWRNLEKGPQISNWCLSIHTLSIGNWQMVQKRNIPLQSRKPQCLNNVAERCYFLQLKYVILKWNTYLLPMPFSSQSSIRKSQRKEGKYTQPQIHPSRHKSASKPPHWGRTWIEQQPNMILLLHLCKLVYIQTYSPMERSTSPYVCTYVYSGLRYGCR